MKVILNKKIEFYDKKKRKEPNIFALLSSNIVTENLKHSSSLLLPHSLFKRSNFAHGLVIIAFLKQKAAATLFNTNLLQSVWSIAHWPSEPGNSPAHTIKPIHHLSTTTDEYVLDTESNKRIEPLLLSFDKEEVVKFL